MKKIMLVLCALGIFCVVKPEERDSFKLFMDAFASGHTNPEQMKQLAASVEDESERDQAMNMLHKYEQAAPPAPAVSYGYFRQELSNRAKSVEEMIELATRIQPAERREEALQEVAQYQPVMMRES